MLFLLAYKNSESGSGMFITKNELRLNLCLSYAYINLNLNPLNANPEK